MPVTTDVTEFDESPKASFADATVQAVIGAVEPVTLQQAKDNLRVVGSDEDEGIKAMITAARMMLEGRINRALVPRTVTDSLHGFYDGIRLSTAPYLDGLTIEYYDEIGDSYALVEGTYELDTSVVPARLFSALAANWPSTRVQRGAVRVSYRAGYDEGMVPAPLKQWILCAVGTMYQHREMTVTGVSVADVAPDFMKWLWQPYMVYA